MPDHRTTTESSAGRRLEAIDGLIGELCGIEQPSHSSVAPRRGPCWLELDHDGPCSWAVA